MFSTQPELTHLIAVLSAIEDNTPDYDLYAPISCFIHNRLRRCSNAKQNGERLKLQAAEKRARRFISPTLYTQAALWIF